MEITKGVVVPESNLMFNIINDVRDCLLKGKDYNTIYTDLTIKNI